MGRWYHCNPCLSQNWMRSDGLWITIWKSKRQWESHPWNSNSLYVNYCISVGSLGGTYRNVCPSQSDLVEEYWIALIDSLKPNDHMALEAGSVMGDLRVSGSKKVILGRNPGLHWSYWECYYWIHSASTTFQSGCACSALSCPRSAAGNHCYTLCLSICSLHSEEILGCVICFGEIYAQGQRELQQIPVEVLDQDNWETSTGCSSGMSRIRH